MADRTLQSGRIRRIPAPATARGRVANHTPAASDTFSSAPATAPLGDEALSAKARVAPFRARVQAAPATGPLLTLSIPVSRPKRPGSHSRRPLFVLGTARRRRARGSIRRGGYYALASARKPRALPRPVTWLLGFTGFSLAFMVAFLAFIAVSGWISYEYFAKDLPSVDNIHSLEFETSRIYDRNGNLLYEMYDPNVGKRTYVTIDRMPRSLIDATIAVEDATFEENNGVDLKGIARAVYINLTDKGQSGGSTITQQLVRRVLLPEKDEQTWLRKIREAILATRVTEKYSKDKILEIYLNEIPYGSLSYGVAAAADTYFGKKVQDLNLAECAMLAGLPQSPSLYDLNVNFDLAKARQRIVLDLMAKSGKITEAESDAAYNVDVHPVVRAAHLATNAPHFVEYVRHVLEEEYGPEVANGGGLRVITTIDLGMQEQAQRIAAQQIDNLKKQGASNAALVAINPRTGEILAMVGSVDFNNPVFGEVNVATSLRQPGSSFKPFTYATALQRGDYNPASILPDLPVKFPGDGSPYIPQNYDGRFRGPVTMRSALANSYNIPAVEMLQRVGVPAVLNMAHKMGITTLNDPERYGLALTLGGGEVTLLDMTSAYGTFANYGYHVPATPFLKIADSKGKVLFELNRDKPEGNQAMERGVAYQISKMLSDNEARTPAFGPNSALKIDGIEAAVKTGTTNDWKDSWTVGYTRALAVGVWVGNNDNKPMAHVAGAIGAAPIWHNFIEQVYKNDEMRSLLVRSDETDVPRNFYVPPGMVRRPVCVLSGMVPTNACTQVKYEWFTINNAPQEQDTWYKWIPVTLHDNGGSIAGPGVPKSDTIERVYVVPPPEYRAYIGGAPPSNTLTISNVVPIMPTPVLVEPPPVAVLVTPVAGAGSRPAGSREPEPLEPIAGLELAISSPQSGSVLSGPVAVLGKANAANFARYRLEYGRPGSDTMTNIVESSVPAFFNVLGVWDTNGLPSGSYVLRLTVETTNGEAVRRDVPVRVGVGLPGVAIASPADGSTVYLGEAVTIDVAADGGGADITGVEIYVDGKRLVSLLAAPWSAQWAVEAGAHEIRAKMYTSAGEEASSGSIYVNAEGLRPTPSPTKAAILWISNLTWNQEIAPGVHDVWVDVAPGSPVQHVDIYIDGMPAGYATGPGYRINPNWTPTPTLAPTQPPTPTLDINAAATATQVAATVEVQGTISAAATGTRVARAQSAATKQAAKAAATKQSVNATASVAAATTSPTPAPPTSSPLPSATPTFVRYEKLPDPMLGDYIARCQFPAGRHRVVAIGYDSNNQEVGRNEAWVVVK
ncbi:MAG: PBP1A family penicillin-binding protein [Chloroflexota bacterium]